VQSHDKIIDLKTNLTNVIINKTTHVKEIENMKDMIKRIRLELGLNQEQLALQLGVSPVTVNRWENGKANPTLMAQNKLYEICRLANVDLADSIVESCISTEEGFLLYHASRKGLTGEIQPISRSKCDFGKGFYMGTEAIQPLTLVCNEEKPKFYQIRMNLDGLKVLDVEVVLDWAMLIAYFRGYMEGEKETLVYDKYSHMADGYDVIAGYIANDRMYQVLTDFFERRITDAALIASLSALKLGRQYVAVTQKACDRIEIIGEKQLSRLELLALKEKSEVRRREGISLAERCVVEHRRDGRYFDEILKGVEV
jgi:transcriptional regulator with XRE-family HTH domain